MTSAPTLPKSTTADPSSFCALRRGYVDTVTVSRVPSGDLTIVEVTVTAPLPVLGLLGPGGTLRVTGHAVDESSLIRER